MEQSPAIKTAIDSSILFFIQAAFTIAACKYTFTATYGHLSEFGRSSWHTRCLTQSCVSNSPTTHTKQNGQQW